MPKEMWKQWHRQHMTWTFLLLFAVSVLLFVFHWLAGIVALLAGAAVAYYAYRAEKAFRKELIQYVGTLSHRVKKAGIDVIYELPLGILLFDEHKTIEWHNLFVSRMLQRNTAIGTPLFEAFPELEAHFADIADRDQPKETTFDFRFQQKIYQVNLFPKERLLYFHDVTSQAKILERYHEEKIALGILIMDNLDEATQGMDEQSRSILLAKVTGLITDWARQHDIYIRRTNSDRFLLLMRQKTLGRLEQNRFSILDEVRDLTGDQHVPFTLSIGIAAGEDNLRELGAMAQSSLEVSLGRGGDQAVVRAGDKLAFYGGRSNAVEKRTRVRARVIAHALRNLIRESDKVIIMGHRMPDMDAVGAAVGILKAVQLCNKEGYIVLEDINPSIEKLMEMINADEHIRRWFVTPEQALPMINEQTLVVVVDTHRESLTAEPRLLKATRRIVVIDHHRRGGEFLSDAVLVYLEPYASSTCELVTELLQYVTDKLSLTPAEATALLAGIAVDTKSFSLRTGARTFEAASLLRRYGADTATIQQFMQEDLQSYILKAEIIKDAEVWFDHIAVAVAKQTCTQLLIAQVADTLLNMSGIKASFVVSQRPDGLIGISARSLGQMNVQVVMERLGGGGHLTNAAAQLEGSLEEAVERLKEILHEIDAEEGLFE